MLLHHIAINVSSEAGIDFYKTLGFKEVNRQKYENYQIAQLSGFCCTLEFFINATHPQKVTNPEANGLRHMAFETEHLEKMREKLIKYNPEEIQDEKRLFFVKDPDGQPIEIIEYTPHPPVGNYEFDG